MITAVVTFKIPDGVTREQWMQQTRAVATRFQDIPGLIRKNFLYSDKGIAGGVYLWETREAAEACYRGPWRDNIRNIAGVRPRHCLVRHRGRGRQRESSDQDGGVRAAAGQQLGSSVGDIRRELR